MEESNGTLNMYRTPKYIVLQNIYLDVSVDGCMVLISQDTYYLRNKKLDKKYEKNFKDRANINGKRVHTSMYTRKYFN